MQNCNFSDKFVSETRLKILILSARMDACHRFTFFGLSSRGTNYNVTLIIYVVKIALSQIEIMIEDIRLGGAMSKTIVEFKDVVKTYGSGEALLYAVNHIDFKIEEGEFVVILGQSGAGKSTVLNILGGMDQPTEEKSKSCDR